MQRAGVLGCKVLRAQQLAGIVFPPVHQEGDALRVLQDVVPLPSGQRRGIFIVPMIEPQADRRSHQEHRR